MGQIEQIFMENPVKRFHIREISRILKMPKTTVSYHIKKLLSENIIKEEKDVFKSFKANESNPLYIFYKKQEAIKSIISSNLVEYLNKETNPKAIILFGSFAKGEYDKNSDIDIFIQAKEQKISVKDFEKKLKHKINIIFEDNINSLSNELFNNIINGVKISGFLKVK